MFLKICFISLHLPACRRAGLPDGRQVGFLLKQLRILGKENYLQILMIMITV